MRFVHIGHWGVRLELGDGRSVCFDPPEAPEGDDPRVLTAGDAERVAGFLAAPAGGGPWIAAPAVAAWAAHGTGAAVLVPPVTIGGLTFASRTYTPIPWATPIEALRKAASALRLPGRAARRLRLHLGLPHAAPTAWSVTSADGRRAVHLGGALHRRTPPRWLEATRAAWSDADLLLVAPDHEEADAVATLLPALAPRRVVVVDLSREVRLALGLPVETEGRLIEALRSRGLDAAPIARRGSAPPGPG